MNDLSTHPVAVQDGLRFFFVDIETTGLLPANEVILEVGIKIVDPRLRLIDEYDVVVWDSPHYDKVFDALKERAALGDHNARFVLDMHDKSGLWGDAQANGLTVDRAAHEVAEFLIGHGISNDRKTGDPMCGSSIAFDRSHLDFHMPSVSSLFHYRNVDTSTIKELCRRMNPGLYSRLETNTVKQEKHRALDDIDDTIGELKFYRDNFFWTTEDEEL